MTKLSAIAVSTLALFAALSGGANASDLSLKDGPGQDGGYSPDRPWQGPYVAIGAGYRWHNWDAAAQGAKCLFNQDDDNGPKKHSAGDTPVQFDGNKNTCHGYEYDSNDATTFVDPVAAFDEDSDGVVVTGRIGYDWQASGYSRVVFGVFAELNWIDANTDHFTDAELMYAGGARLGYLLTDRLLGYANAGIEFTDYDHLDTKVDPFLGGGLEYRLGSGWSVAAEGRWTFADDGDLPAGASNNDPVTGRLLVVKKF